MKKIITLTNLLPKDMFGFPIRSITKSVVTNPFFIGSLIMVIGSNIYNSGQFVYHFMNGRFLGKALYGDLASIVSLFGIVGIIQLSINLVIVKFVASSKSEKELNNFSRWVNYWSIWLGLILAIMVVILAPFLVDFFKISDINAVLLLAPLLFFLTLANTYRSILQGLLSFGKVVTSLLFDSFFRVFGTLAFLILGIGLVGSVSGLLVAMIVGALLGFLFTKDKVLGQRGKMPNLKPLIKFSVPVFVNGLALTSMYTVDLLLVKHFFPAVTAGLYASLAVLGRVVFFGTTPIGQVMFPMIIKKYTHGENYHKILYISIGLVSFYGIFITIIYAIIPDIPIGLLYGQEYIEGSNMLWWFGLFMGLLGLASLLIQFYLSIGKVRVVSLFLLAAFAQVILIWFIHESILQVVQISIFTTAALVLALLLYLPIHDKK